MIAGGEFRFGTASIYMMKHEHIRTRRTSIKYEITWLRFGGLQPTLRVFSTTSSQRSRDARTRGAESGAPLTHQSRYSTSPYKRDSRARQFAGVSEVDP